MVLEVNPGAHIFSKVSGIFFEAGAGGEEAEKGISTAGLTRSSFSSHRLRSSYLERIALALTSSPKEASLAYFFVTSTTLYWSSCLGISRVPNGR